MAESMRTRKRRSVQTRADEPIRAVAYVRLSKAKPDDKTTPIEKGRNTEASLETQLAGCERHIAAQGGSVVAVEQDIQSGDRLDRPGLWRAIERIQDGEANALIVYAVDRFGRDSVQQGVAVHAIRSAGGRLLSATENLEEGPLGDFMRSAMTFAAAVELGKIRERTTRAFDAKYRQRGAYKPSVRPPYGYHKIGNGTGATYEVEPREAAIVRRIFTERAAGKSIRSILVGLNDDLIPTPSGRGRWGTHTVDTILAREVYATGKHECWRTQVLRDASGVPVMAERPPDERYFAAFPPFLDPALVERARATDERNVWHSRRNDRPAEYGLLRYGFARCAGCGRALAINFRGNQKGRPRYDCRAFYHHERSCSAPASISVDLLDVPVLTWLQSIIEDPSRADAYRVERQSAMPDAAALAAATAAEARVGELEQHIAGLIDKLTLLSGPAAEIAASRINAVNDDLAAARVERDRLAEACRVAVADDALTLVPRDVLAATILEAIQAMVAADQEPTHTFTVLLHLPEGAAEYTVPLSWKAWQAGLAVLNVTVTVAQEKSDLPRWVADINLPGGIVVSSPPHVYLFPSSP